jgi:hypothetical protein
LTTTEQAAAARVALERVDSVSLAELLRDAWERKAPARLSTPRERG